MPDEDRILLRTVARVQIAAGRGTLARQLARVEAKEQPVPSHVPTLCTRCGILILKYPYRLFNLKTDLEDLARVEKNTRSYCGKGSRLPAPWINVISNSHFGFQISGNQAQE